MNSTGELQQCQRCGVWWYGFHCCPNPFPEEKPYLCPKCDGMTTESKKHPMLYPTETLCPTCGGTGVVWR